MAELPPDIFAAHPEYTDTLKFDDWFRYYTDSNDKTTYSNATQAAIKAYALDPVTQYGSARVIGSTNLTKLNNLAVEILEQEGWGLPKMLTFALTQMVESKTKGQNWWKNLMLVTGQIKPMAVQIANNTAITNVQISPEERKKMSADFSDFINKKYAPKVQPPVPAIPATTPPAGGTT